MDAHLICFLMLVEGEYNSLRRFMSLLLAFFHSLGDANFLCTREYKRLLK